MTRIFKPATALALGLSLFALPAAAQDSGAVDLGVSTGEPVAVAPPSREDVTDGQQFLAATHGDWSLRCVRAPEDQGDACSLYQLLKDATGKDTAEISLYGLPNGGEALAGANIITPLETLLTEGLVLSVDGGAPRRYPFTFCAQVGCVSRVGLTGPDVAAFKAGSAANIVIRPARAPENAVELTVSLSGFTAGYNAVIAANEAREAKLAALRAAQDEAGEAGEKPAE